MFAEKFAEQIKEDVMLFLPDGGQFNGYFSVYGNLLYGLKNLMTTYGVKEKYVMFFEFVGISSFYVTIYNEEGEDIFNTLAEKLMLRTLVEGEKVQGIILVYCTLKIFPHVLLLSLLPGIDLAEEVGHENYVTARGNNEGQIYTNIVLIK